MLAIRNAVERGNSPALPIAVLAPSEVASQVKAAICQETADICFEHFLEPSLCALVLTGSLARGEASLAEENASWTVAGDADFLMVFKHGTNLPASPAVELVTRKIEEKLRQRQITCHIGLSPVSPKYLRRLRPHIFGYELMVSGQVIRGEADILSLIPAFAPEHIPLYDAWCLLNNRMIEQLEITDHGSIRPGDAQYRTIKLYLDMATSLLVFVQAYKPTYRERLVELRNLARNQRQRPDEDYPFPLAEFSDRVALCTQLKINYSQLREEPLSTSPHLWREAIEYAGLLWAWESRRLNSTAPGFFPRCRRWLRGWLHVLRCQGWHQSWRDWHRWATLGVEGSPRLLVYSAAAPLFSQLPRLLSTPTQDAFDSDWEKLRKQLPLRSEERALRQSTSWQRLASEISWNYRELLVSTRS